MTKQKYFEPNADLNLVKEKQKIVVRFATEEDVQKFVQQTGIQLIRNKTNYINYKCNANTLDF